MLLTILYSLSLSLYNCYNTVVYNNNNNNNNNNNRPDIIIKNKKDKTCLLIDVAIPSDKNVIQKEAEKK
jgi:hypothetical protein